MFFLITAMLLMSSVAKAQSDDYTPLVREGVKWVYLYNDQVECADNFPDWYSEDDYDQETGFFGNGKEFYYFEFQGDEIIDGVTYKKLYCTFNVNSDLKQLLPIAFCREENGKVYTIENPAATNQFANQYHFLPLMGGINDNLLYDFANPENMATTINANIEQTQSTNCGNQQVRSWLLKTEDNKMFRLIEGVGPDGEASGIISGMDFLSFPYTNDNPFTCMAPTRKGLVGLLDANGQFIYKGSCYDSYEASGDYLPLVREGVKWVYTETYNNEWVNIEDGRLYSYEFRGDTIINGKTYKKCYWSTDQPTNKQYYVNWQSWDTSQPVVGLREEGKRVYGVIIQPSFIHSVYESEIWKPTSDIFEDWLVEEWLIYDFDTATNGLIHLRDVEISGHSCAVLGEKGWNDSSIELMVEGVGYVANYYDLLLEDFLCDCGYNVEHNLHHMEDADGNILYKGPSYNYKFWTKGDFKRDGKVDVEDINFIINYILHQLPKGGFYEDYAQDMKAWCDLNEDGKVDIEDVNMVINTILSH